MLFHAYNIQIALKTTTIVTIMYWLKPKQYGTGSFLEVTNFRMISKWVFEAEGDNTFTNSHPCSIYCFATICMWICYWKECFICACHLSFDCARYVYHHHSNRPAETSSKFTRMLNWNALNMLELAVYNSPTLIPPTTFSFTRFYFSLSF